MLALDDPRWSELQQAYGQAAGIPKLLSELKASENHFDQKERWRSLWSSLCHQGDVYTASYAALPHIVQIAGDANSTVSFDFFLLPTSIEIARFNGKGPEVPSFLNVSYQSGLKMLMHNAIAHQAKAWDEAMTLSIAAALAVAKGHHRVAEAIANLDDDWISKIVGDSR